jgi:FkbM family methyltransferase
VYAILAHERPGIFMDNSPRFEYRAMRLPGGRSVDLALPQPSTDPVVNAYAAGNPLNGYLVDLLQRFTQAGDRVLDLGCHVGTLSVPAAALGRRVLAVDASPLHVEAVRRAAQRNRLDDLAVRWCAVADTDGEIDFNENGLWGMVRPQTLRATPRDEAGREARGASPALPPSAGAVAARRADTLLGEAGWSAVEFVKMDVEGSELAAIESLGDVLASDRAPVVVYESNGMTFEIFGYDIARVRSRLEQLGYITCRVEGARLVYCPPSELQPEAWLDVVALPPRLQRSGDVVRAWDREAMVRRCLEWGTNEHRNVRQYLQRAFASSGEYPRDDRRIASLRRDLDREFQAGAPQR